MIEKGDIVYNRLADEICKIKEVGEEQVKQVGVMTGVELVTGRKYLRKV